MIARPAPGRLARAPGRASVRTLAAAALLSTLLTSAAAGDGPLVDWLAPRLEDGRVTSAVVAHLTPAGLHLSTAGVTPAGAAPTPTTRYPIGSVSKVFTNLLLQVMANDGLVALTDTLGAYLPDGLALANPAVGSITLSQLATHTSGLPRLPGNFAPGDHADPYADFTADRLWAAVAGARSQQPLGRGYAYSNFGMGLLGFVLGEVDGRGWCQAVQARVTEPLGLSATGCDPCDVVDAWAFDALAGAGALWSHAGDLVLLARATLALPEDAPQLQVATRTDTGGVPAFPELTPVWHVARADGQPVFWHNGSVEVAQSFVGIRRDAGEALIVLVAGEADPTLAALAVLGSEGLDRSPLPEGDLERLVGQYQLNPQFGMGVYVEHGMLLMRPSGQTSQVLQPVGNDWWALSAVDASVRFVRDEAGRTVALELAQHGRIQRAERIADVADTVRLTAIEVPAEILAGYVGQYRMFPQVLLSITERDGQLFTQLTGQPELVIVPYEPDRFFLRVVDAQLHFERDDEGKVVAVVLHQGGLKHRAERE